MAERIDLTEAPLPPARPPRKGNGRGAGSSKLEDFARRMLAPAACLSGLLALYLCHKSDLFLSALVVEFEQPGSSFRLPDAGLGAGGSRRDLDGDRPGAAHG